MGNIDRIYNISMPYSIIFWLCSACDKLLVKWIVYCLELGQEDPLEKEMAIHFSILAWRIPWTEVPSRLQSMELQRVGHDESD